MRIGVLGGGQLGMMLAESGIPLGHSFRFFDPSPEAPAQNFGEHVCAEYEDHNALAQFADGLDVCTYEFENVSLEAARLVNEKVRVLPGLNALEQGQDRGLEKALFSRLGIPVPEYALVESHNELERYVQDLGVPGVLKTRRMGYDGKGQVVIRRISELEEDWNSIGERPAIFEKFVTFDEELSIIGVSASSGETSFYPLVQNTHRDGILRTSIAPASCAPALQSQAEHYTTQLMNELNYIGVLTIEFFRVGDELLANEFAPRVHNSGHWTIEGAECSQFENHIRAITHMTLGSTAAIGYSKMENIIGELPNQRDTQPANAHVHLYGKSPRSGRKLGHITTVSDKPFA